MSIRESISGRPRRLIIHKINLIFQLALISIDAICSAHFSIIILENKLLDVPGQKNFNGASGPQPLALY